MHQLGRAAMNINMRNHQSKSKNSLQTLSIKSKDPTSECNKSSNSSFDSSSPGILQGSCWKIKTVSVWFLYSYDNDVLIWLHLIHCEWKWVIMFQLFQSDSSKLPAVFPVWTKMSAAIRTSSSRFLWDVKRLKRFTQWSQVSVGVWYGWSRRSKKTNWNNAYAWMARCMQHNQQRHVIHKCKILFGNHDLRALHQHTVPRSV